MQIKPGASLAKLTPQMALAAYMVDSLSYRLGIACTITSGSDSTHKDGSLHYTGNALDFRSRDIPPQKMVMLIHKIRASLGADFDVVEEKDHLHIEYDPKP